MRPRIDFHTLLSQTNNREQKIASFALLSLGISESLISGAITASGAIELFFHADNCLFVRKQLRQPLADEIMSRGVQLSDVFEALPTEEAQQEFQRELAVMRSLSLKLIENRQRAA